MKTYRCCNNPIPVKPFVDYFCAVRDERATNPGSVDYDSRAPIGYGYTRAAATASLTALEAAAFPK